MGASMPRDGMTMRLDRGAPRLPTSAVTRRGRIGLRCGPGALTGQTTRRSVAQWPRLPSTVRLLQ